MLVEQSKLLCTAQNSVRPFPQLSLPNAIRFVGAALSARVFIFWLPAKNYSTRIQGIPAATEARPHGPYATPGGRGRDGLLVDNGN